MTTKYTAPNGNSTVNAVSIKAALTGNHSSNGRLECGDWRVEGRITYATMMAQAAVRNGEPDDRCSGLRR